VADDGLVVGIQAMHKDIVDSLMQEVVVWMILEKEQQCVVQVKISHRLMQFFMMT
jgi:hypothetical protein